MIEFIPCQDEAVIRKLCNEAQVAYVSEMFAYIATQDEKQIGFGLYALEQTRVCVLHVPDDDYLADVLTRSGMNYAQIRGIELANFTNANNIPLLKVLNFVKDDINLDIEIKYFLNGCKNCEKS